MQPETKTELAKRKANAGKKIYWPRLAMMLWVFFFPLCFMMLTSGPPAKVGAYVCFVLLAGVPLIWGSVGYRVFGLVAIVLSLWAANAESRAGVRYQAHKERMRQIMVQRNAATNAPATNATPATHE
jgi:hypothetical protein